MLAALAFSFTYLAQQSVVLTPVQQDQVAVALEEDAQIMSNTQLAEQLVGQPADVQAEILRINTEASHTALRVAMLVPLLAALLGFFNSLRMVRLPDLEPLSSAEEMLMG